MSGIVVYLSAEPPSSTRPGRSAVTWSCRHTNFPSAPKAPPPTATSKRSASCAPLYPLPCPLGVYWRKPIRSDMEIKTCLLWAALACAMPQFAQTPAPTPAETLTPAQLNARAKARNVPEIPFESAPDFLKLPPNLYLGEGIGVATNSKGHIFVYTRSQATRLFEFDAKGNYLREIGEGLYGFAFAHAVRVDAQDNIWAVDEGTNMVIKFNPEGRVVMVLGRRPEPAEAAPAAPEPYTFNRPTDVAWDAAGNIFVSDGYGNSRVVKDDKN